MKNSHLFLDVFVLVVLVLIQLYRPGANLSSHDAAHVVLGASSGCQNRSSFLQFLTFSFIYLLFCYFLSFRLFRWFRFVRLDGFVSLVSVVSLRPFRFVVLGFSTSIIAQKKQTKCFKSGVSLPFIGSLRI